MFRTARGFLLYAPPAFLLGLVAFLVVHPGAAEKFTPYPFLADALGPVLLKRPVLRFVMTAALFFLPPYLITGLLLFLADLGASGAAPLWRRRGSRRPDLSAPPESRWAFLLVTFGSCGVLGALLHRVAHGGELPGGINVAPVFVAGVPFVGMACASFVALLAALPRGIWEVITRSRERREA